MTDPEKPGHLDVFVQLDYQVGEYVAVDATATLDGKTLEVFSRGSGGQDQQGGEYCERPGWSTVVPPGGDPASTIAIELADESAAITYELVNPFAERTIQASTGGSMSVFPGAYYDGPGLAGDLVLPPGQEVTLSWSPVSNTVSSAVLIGRSETAGQIFYLTSTDITVEGSTLRFVAPADASQATRVALEGGFAPATRRCEDADACAAGSRYCSEMTVSAP